MTKNLLPVNSARNIGLTANCSGKSQSTLKYFLFSVPHMTGTLWSHRNAIKAFLLWMRRIDTMPVLISSRRSALCAAGVVAGTVVLSACILTPQPQPPATPTQPGAHPPTTVRPAGNRTIPAASVNKGQVDWPVTTGKAIYPDRTPSGAVVVNCPAHLFYMQGNTLYELVVELASTTDGSTLTLGGNICWVGILRNYQPGMVAQAADFDRIWPSDAKSQIAEALSARTDPSRKTAVSFTCR